MTDPAQEPEEDEERADVEPEAPGRGGGGWLAWTGSWWPAWGPPGSMWSEPKPIPGTGEWVDCESELAADQWSSAGWHRVR